MNVQERASGQLLADREIQFFKRNGYLVKRRILDPGAMNRAIDRAWCELPPHFDREDPATWRGVLTDSCETREMAARRGVVKLRQCLWGERGILDMFPANSTVSDIVEQLLGPDKVHRPRHIRGIYLNFPVPALRDSCSYSSHYEKHSLQLGTTAYLDSVEPGGGEFVVFPKSHLLLNRAFRTRWNDDGGWRVTVARRLSARCIKPVRITGDAGDIIFWHHRLLHGRCLNVSRKIRYAAVCDFCTNELEQQKTNAAPWNTHDATRPAFDPWQDWAI